MSLTRENTNFVIESVSISSVTYSAESSAADLTLVRDAFFQIKTTAAYPPSAQGAKVKFQTGVQIGLFKSRLVFLLPHNLAGFFMFNGGKASCHKRNSLACPFFSAAVAKKTE